MAVLLALVLHASVRAQGASAPPFRYYTVQDGLNQRLVQAFAQDAHGFIWLATWGGLNRYDGKSFKSLTSRQGLRVNGSTALVVDDRGRLWVGDTGGGLTVLEHGVPVAQFAPHPELRAPVRALYFTGDTLYIGYQSLGVGRLRPDAADAAIQRLANAPAIFTRTILAAPDGDLLVQSVNQGLLRMTSGSEPTFSIVEADATALRGGPDGQIVAGNRHGQIGRWENGHVTWQTDSYGARVTDVAFVGNDIKWVSTRTSIGPSDRPQQRIAVNGPGRMLVDRDGVLWLLTSSGLGRYLGTRFVHYPLAQNGTDSIVYAIDRDAGGRYWFGTGTGLLMSDVDGELEDINARLGLPPCEVRDLLMLAERNELWMGCAWGRSQRIDLASMTAQPVFSDSRNVVLVMERDSAGVIWAGTGFGLLIAEDPVRGVVRTVDFGRGRPIYSLAADANNQLWIAVQNSGIYRLDTSRPDSAAQQVLPLDRLGGQTPMHLSAHTDDDGGSVLWAATLGGRIVRWRDDQVDLSIEHPVLAGQSIYSLVPMSDQTLAVGTERGLYRYNYTTRDLDYYGENEGFQGVETKNHAIFRENNDTLWFGTGAGATRMDLRVPMQRLAPPPATVVSVRSGAQTYTPPASTAVELASASTTIEFAAVTSRHARDIEFSHRMLGMQERWSAPGELRSVQFGNLPPGNLKFEVRARRAGEAWSAPATVALRVPTPLWQRTWFQMLAAAMLAAACLGFVRLRTLRIARANAALQREVDERTRSIAERTQQLKLEIEERAKAELARTEMETRFQRAYENSPLGMALVDTDGTVFDLNPRMRQSFWRNAPAPEAASLIEVIDPQQQGAFRAFLKAAAKKRGTGSSEEFRCTAHAGDPRIMVFTLSPIDGPTGTTRYFLVMTQDVTMNREMTRKLEYQASFDELTGLNNRRSFATCLRQTWETSANDKPSYLLAIDLDRFKIVNDTCGHAAGDALLIEVAETLRQCVRDSDMVARNGGDEFAIILMGCGEKVARDKAELVRQRIEALRFQWDGELFRIGASIGVVRVDADANSLEELTMLADTACYNAKESGRNRVVFVAAEQSAAQEQRAEARWAQRLPLALERDEFNLHWQHFTALGDQTDAEAHSEVLLRLYDSVHDREIAPGAFFPSVERFGLSRAIDEWVVHKVIEWLREQPGTDSVQHHLWVNLSGTSMNDSQFRRGLLKTIGEADLAPGSINFEVTETAAMRSLHKANALIAALREMGCQFALDDFGSGVSSFGYLKSLDVDFVKIDGTFVRNLANDRADMIFVKSIIDVAHSLGIKAVAEFVEDHQTLEIVRILGADYAQGFGLHRPELMARGTRGDLDTKTAASGAPA